MSGCVMSDSAGRWNLHEEGVQRMLESGDRTVGVREGGLEMCEDLGSRPVRRRIAGNLAGSSGGRQFPRGPCGSCSGPGRTVSRCAARSGR